MMNIDEELLVCSTCQVQFDGISKFKAHYSSLWHNYNAKQKALEKQPVSYLEYLEHIKNSKEAETAKNEKLNCRVCKKSFKVAATYENHLQTKKHIAKVNEPTQPKAQTEKKSQSKESGPPEPLIVEEESDVEELSDDEWNEEWLGTAIPAEGCLFCNESFDDVMENLRHMDSTHGFFIPNLDRCTDIYQLMTYLGAKVGAGYDCLTCDMTRFRSLKSVRMHMVDAEHKALNLETGPFKEYLEFYLDDPESVADDAALVMTQDAWELQLCSGKWAAHRGYAKLLSQKHLSILPKKEKGCKHVSVGHVMTKVDKAKQLRGMKLKSRRETDHHMKLGIKANKLISRLRLQYTGA